MINKKRVVVIIIIIIVLSLFVFNRIQNNNSINNSQNNVMGQVISSQIEIVPLSIEEREKVAQIILTSEFIKDIPKKESVALIFYSVEDGQTIWRDGFLIGQNQLLSEGEPSVQLTMNSRFISEIDNNDLCGLIQTAVNNGELGFQSEYNKITLFIKFAKMLKHRECFGF
jgi:hypothetical protein